MGQILQDGTYHAAARGCFGDIPVEVTIQEGRITDIKVLQNQDTPDFSGIGPNFCFVHNLLN